MVYVHLFWLIIGLILLVKGSDFFVEASSRIAKRFGVSQFVIGLTLVAIGTSIPELASSITASINNLNDLVIGNVVGSNIANIGLIVGVAGVFSVIKAKKHMLKLDGQIMIFMSFLAFLLIVNGFLSRIEGFLLIILYFSYLIFLLRSKRDLEKMHFVQFLEFFLKMDYIVTLKDKIKNNIGNFQIKGRNKKTGTKTAKDFIIIVSSIVAIVYGARYLVNEAVWFANFFNLSQVIIGLSVIAIGTSLPELGVSISAARKGYGDMVLGNIMGSNVANIMMVLGISAFINPISIPTFVILYTAPFMLAMSILLLVFIRSHWQIRRTEALILVTLYILFLIFIFSVNA